MTPESCAVYHHANSLLKRK